MCMIVISLFLDVSESLSDVSVWAEQPTRLQLFSNYSGWLTPIIRSDQT